MTAVGINLSLGGNIYWGDEHPFLDRYKTTGIWSVQGAPAGVTNDSIRFDADGYPLAIPAGVGNIYTNFGVDPKALSMPDRYVLTYAGKADIYLGSVKIVSSEAGKIVFDYTGDSNEVYLSLNAIDAANPIHNIHIVREDQLGLFQAGQIFNPAFLEKASHWEVLRFMDWGQTNGSTLANWADRAMQGDASWSKDVPLEVMVALANQAHVDVWYNVPAHATDEFVRQALGYIKNNLDPSLKLHLEYSNEVWNFSFEQAHHAMAEGDKLFGVNSEGSWAKYSGYRSAQIAAISDTVFGDQADARVINVLATQTAWKGLENYIFAGIAAANVGAAGTLFEDYAITTYFGGTLMGNTPADRAIVLQWARAGAAGIDAAIRELATGGQLSGHDSLVDQNALVLYQAAVAKTYGLNLVAYEGGLHITATNFTTSEQPEIVAFFQRLTEDPRVGNLYTQMATNFAAAGGTEIVAYANTGKASIFGAWGNLDNIYQDHSPRYDALKALQAAYEASQQAPAVPPPVVAIPPVVSVPPVVVTPPVVVAPPVVIVPPVVVNPTPVSQTPVPPISTFPPQTINTGNGVIHTVETMVLSFGAQITVLDTVNPQAKSAINLTGNELSQRIVGNDGANIIIGGGGADTLVGLGGDDTFLVMGQGETVTEAVGGGSDIVFTTGSYNLGANEVEVLSTVTHADTTPINLIGNYVSQKVIGNYGDNILNGGSGVDTLIGLVGNDIYAVGDSRALVVESDGNGNDTVVASVDYRLNPGNSVEVLAAQDRGSSVGLRLTGNELSQTIAGTAGADILNGGGGRDVLIGGAGPDRFDIGSALSSANLTAIADFQGNIDRIGLSSGVFNGLGSGVDAAEFAIGSTATTADQRIIYNASQGQLFYDADGAGGGAAILFALLTPGTLLGATSFEIIAPLAAI